jgi:hypothetical protein
VLRWRALVSAARAEEVPDEQADEHLGEAWALLENTAEALGQADARLWACACLRRLPLLEGGAGPALLADRRRAGVVAAAELFACGLLGADELRHACHEALTPGVPAQAGTATTPRRRRRRRPAVGDTDPGHLILWTVAEADPALAGIAPPGPARRHASPDDPDDAYRLYITPLGAAGRFLGADGSSSALAADASAAERMLRGRLSLLVRQAVAAADRLLRERRGRGPGHDG